MSGPLRSTIAVADDDPRILEALQELLESAGYEVRSHSSGTSLLASGVSDVDCVITDIGMPTMDGFELRDAVKQIRPELPVILISGRRDLSQEQNPEGLGDSLFFRKPFDGQTLLAAIDNALGRSQSHRP
jgi:FixJ family two-component response regulator